MEFKSHEEINGSEKPDSWNERLRELRKRDSWFDEKGSGYNLEKPTFDIFSISPESIDAMKNVTIQSNQLNLSMMKDFEGGMFYDKFRSLMSNEKVIGELLLFQKQLKNIDEWWTLDKEKKREILTNLGCEAPSNMVSKIAFKIGFDKEEDWLDIHFIYLVSLLSSKIKPLYEKLQLNSN